ncbi:hypothetical protein GUJ93_ZPchr0003g18334 [Zizania palustris]|uniref:Uncharacterized protein n=1 Tax=Zizania palustris TaxID=103762 RepID=A0A8J5S7Q0_ZIZPA|nr:hypothetical protein GUJ93_ZPchr0003g18334 [Zizania palustris]
MVRTAPHRTRGGPGGRAATLLVRCLSRCHSPLPYSLVPSEAMRQSGRLAAIDRGWSWRGRQWQPPGRPRSPELPGPAHQAAVVAQLAVAGAEGKPLLHLVMRPWKMANLIPDC